MAPPDPGCSRQADQSTRDYKGILEAYSPVSWLDGTQDVAVRHPGQPSLRVTFLGRQAQPCSSGSSSICATQPSLVLHVMDDEGAGWKEVWVQERALPPKFEPSARGYDTVSWRVLLLHCLMVSDTRWDVNRAAISRPRHYKRVQSTEMAPSESHACVCLRAQPAFATGAHPLHLTFPHSTRSHVVTSQHPAYHLALLVPKQTGLSMLDFDAHYGV
eukprot:1143456-Pelagomonas_calceolata.AAC.16